MDIAYIVGGIIVVLVIAIIALYNGLVRLRVRVEEAWADIDVQLKRRYDLIPNLVETVKGYAAHEKETLTAVIEARSKASAINIDAKGVTAEQMATFASMQSGLTGALSKLFALSERYPDLKANENFLELQRSLEDTEDKIQASRRFYNGNVRDYNTKLEVVPSNFIADWFKFEKKAFFELAEGSEEKENVKVQF